MGRKVAIFWPGDYRSQPNQAALPHVEEATLQMEKSLVKLGRESYRIENFLTKHHEAIERLGKIDELMIGV